MTTDSINRRSATAIEVARMIMAQVTSDERVLRHVVKLPTSYKTQTENVKEDGERAQIYEVEFYFKAEDITAVVTIGMTVRDDTSIPPQMDNAMIWLKNKVKNGGDSEFEYRFVKFTTTDSETLEVVHNNDFERLSNFMK